MRYAAILFIILYLMSETYLWAWALSLLLDICSSLPERDIYYYAREMPAALFPSLFMISCWPSSERAAMPAHIYYWAFSCTPARDIYLPFFFIYIFSMTYAWAHIHIIIFFASVEESPHRVTIIFLKPPPEESMIYSTYYYECALWHALWVLYMHRGRRGARHWEAWYYSVAFSSRESILHCFMSDEEMPYCCHIFTPADEPPRAQRLHAFILRWNNHAAILRHAAMLFSRLFQVLSEERWKETYILFTLLWEHFYFAFRGMFCFT